MKSISQILLVIGIAVLVNLIAQEWFVRFDLTEDKQYTLSSATKDILHQLEDPVTVTAYFSSNLPPQYDRVRQDFRDMLVEYHTWSDGMVEFEFIDPNEDEQVEQEVLREGLRPVLINVREKDEVQQKKAYMGAILRLGQRKEAIPLLISTEGMEYALSTAIKKLSVKDKASLAILSGHGEAGPEELAPIYDALSVLFNVENFDMNAQSEIPVRFKAVALVRPTDTIPPQHFDMLDAYLEKGGQLFIAADVVSGDLQQATGTAIHTGIADWLATKGIQIQRAFLLDVSCAPITVQQRQGFFTIATQMPFPYIPIFTHFADHPITKGLEQVVMPFASPLKFTGDSAVQFTPLVWSSEKATTRTPPVFFDVVNMRMQDADFDQSNLPVAALLEGQGEGRLIVIGDGDFPISSGRSINPDNINLMVNSMEFLADDTGLIALRTKGVHARPIEQKWLGDEAEATRNLIKYGNVLAPILLIIIYGLVRAHRNRNKRIKLMETHYA